MSAERQQKHVPGDTGQGAASTSRISSLQNPEKHGVPYGSAPDITSSGVYKTLPPKGRVQHARTKNASRLPRPKPGRVREMGRYEGMQKKRNLPNMRSATPDGRGMMMEKEMMESQNRKLQMEISTLQTENKLLKDKYNRASTKISHLEEQLSESKEQIEILHGSLNQELSEVERRNKSQASQEVDLLQTKILTLTKENQTMKNEVLSLEKQLESAHKNMDRALLNSEKNRTLDAHKLEIATLKDEVTRVKSLLEQSERHLQEEDSRSKELSQQVIKLTEMKNLLQQQIEMGGGGATATDKQIKSLEKRLRITEERLHQERADRANNLSQVEDKLLTENARLQATEKELNRQLHREKDKNRNLENKIKDTREDNERLRLSLPFDEAALTTQKSYDIPYGVHASQRQETVKKDYRQILSQLETEAGLKAGQEKDMICQLWNTRQQTYHQLRQLEITLQALNLRDNNIAEGLKNLRDVKSHADAQLKQLQEQLEDVKLEKETQETTYKEQLTLLVNERHDAFARLKTAEDLMEAIRGENEILKASLSGGGASSLGASLSLATNGRIEALQAQTKDLESQVQQVTRNNHLLNGELSTLRIQLEARDKALEDAQSELDLARSHLTGDGYEDRKQDKIDKLSLQINEHQAEIKLLHDKVASLNTEKSRLERDLEASFREVSLAKAKVKETKHGEMTDNKQSQMLREELEERDRRLGKLSQEYDALEAELQTARQDLYAEQIQSQDFEAQIESYQSQIEQRGQILDTLSGTEKEQLAQFQILKETLDSVSQELNQKCAEMKVLNLEMSKEKDRYEYMEKELTTLKRDNPLKVDDQAGETSLPSHMLQIRELETERDHLKIELIEMTDALKQATEENGNLDKAIKQMEQELMNEKSSHLQTSAERGELEQHLEEIAEEHDALSQERDQSEEDIVRLETNLKDIVHKFEMEARKNHENFASKYPQVPAEALKMAGELDSLRVLMDAKHKEHEMLNDKISRQQVEMDFLNRRVELLHNENQCNRDDIARLTSEVSAKIKEGVANREMNQFLVKERARLQKENAQLSASVEKEKGIKERRRAEIADVMRKVERTEESTKTTSREVLQKEAIIANLEAELGQTRQNCQSLELDRSQLLGKLDNLQQDVDNKAVLTSTLETHLETERGRLEEEKSNAAKKQDELVSTCHELERLRHEHGLLLNNLNHEKQTVDNLKGSLDVQQQSCAELQDQVNVLTKELESTQSQLTTSRETVEGLKQDKGAIYQEYDAMIKRLSERDQTIAELQNKCDRTEQQMQKELTLQKHSLERENSSTERDLEVTREKVELDGKLRHMESTVGDTDLLTQGLRKETITLQETIARQQESLSTLQLEHSTMRDKMRIQEEKLTDQILVLEKTNNDLRNQYDGEKSYLKDNLMQTQSRVASVESSLASAIDSRDKLQVSNRMQERSLEETKERLQEEITCRKVAEQRAESLQSQLHELRKDKFLSEEKLNQMNTDLTKTEQMMKTEKDRAKRLLDQQQELEATVYTQESTAQAKQEQIDLQQEYEIDEEVLQQLVSVNEMSKLRQILESQKQQLNAKLKKTTTELKQQIEIIEEDRVRVIQQNQSLSADVERARDQLAMKNKENLRLQETILGQEDQLREHTLQLRRAEDARKAEEELQSKLSSKFVAQEEELKRMKIYLSKKAEEAGDNEKSMWMDLNRLIQDMNRQLHEHMESQKSGGHDSKDRDVKQLSKYKKRVIDLESELSTEKAVHQITKSSLQALEEDNQRLRHQYHAMRRRDNVTSDKKYKSRMEAINEIIAKSQTQAQAMLAASGYYDDPQKSLYSPRTDYRGSPDNSLASDMSFNSTGPIVIPPYTGSSPTKVTAGAMSPRK
ncbi:myosin-7-like [Ylistrum balloti]|uniref:myosin-7-like n=1 Tax=Ylistrum balloti TaxID=509963 RepID=UPI002905D907|nr:myosin-7-like [Ylistrum balloti]